MIRFVMQVSSALALALVLSSTAWAQGEQADQKQEDTKQEKVQEPAKKAAITYVFDSAQSKVHWKGGKVIGGSHEGVISVKSGELTWDGGPKSAEVVIDMSTIVNTDISREGSKKKLEDHLKNEDFFYVSKFPFANLKVKSFEATSKVGVYKVSADITIRGVTKPISYESELKVEGDTLVGSGVITVDRTEFNVKYNSAKFFPDIGDKIIKDDFVLTYNFKAQKK